MSQLSEYQKQILSELNITNWLVRDPDVLELGPVGSVANKSIVSDVLSAEKATTSDVNSPKTAPLKTDSASGRIAQMQAAISQNTSKSAAIPKKTLSEKTLSEKTLSEKTVSEAKPVPEARLAPETKKVPVVNQAPQVIAKPLKQEVLILDSEPLPVSDLIATMSDLNIPYRIVDIDEALEFDYVLLISASEVSLITAKDRVIVSALTPENKKRVWQTLCKFNSDNLKRTNSVT